MSDIPFHVFFVAGEDSGDRLGAALMQALRHRRGSAVRFSGVGGAQMVAQGLSSLFPLGDLAIVGFAAIPLRLSKILRRIRETADAVIAARPDVLVIIDSPEFTHRVARRVRESAPAIPIIDYVCPSVWAWRPSRARAMHGYIDHVLTLLPFEQAALRRLEGPASTYVGHPVGERVEALRPNAEEARRRLSDPPRLLVMPGSRSGEIWRLAGLFGKAAKLLSDRIGGLEVTVPSVPRLADMARAAVKNWQVPARVVTDPDEKDAAFRTARAALTKSGTSTLELAVAGVPMVAGYRVSLAEELVARALIEVPSIILANLVLGGNVVPELMQRQCTPVALASALLPLMSDTRERRLQTEAFARLDAIMEIGRAVPSDRAAAAVLQCAGRIAPPRRETVAPPSISA
jgi:lipid-A-disaccharide synthase